MLSFPLSLQITAVISAHNDNTKPYNLTAIVASLNSPMDFSMYIQNFTHRVGAKLCWLGWFADSPAALAVARLNLHVRFQRQSVGPLDTAAVVAWQLTLAADIAPSCHPITDRL